MLTVVLVVSSLNNPTAMKKIFVTSHDKDWLFLVNKSLEQAGYEVHFVEQGATPQKESPDVYIIDTMSKEEISNCKYLNFGSSHTTVPVVIASADHSIKRSALNSGANNFLKKPFSTVNLISVIEKL
jgi:two-component system, OmpR family, phosphate regulon response regulator PhoB